MKKSIIMTIWVLLSFNAVAAKAVHSDKGYEMPDTKVIPIKDSSTGNQYELYIKLPEDYAKHRERKYPVIYFTDAVWHIEMLSASIFFLMDQAILVGISWQKDVDEALLKEDGPYVSRYRDYSVRPSSKPEEQAKYQYGQAAKHLNFIRNDVINFVEKRYRADPQQRAYFGYSLGGLFGAYVLLAEPSTFKNYILGSPSIWRNMPLLSKVASSKAAKNKILEANVFISYGDREARLSKHVDEFIAFLRAREDKGLALKHEVVEGTHQTAFPITGVRAVQWLSNLSKVQG